MNLSLSEVFALGGGTLVAAVLFVRILSQILKKKVSNQHVAAIAIGAAVIVTVLLVPKGSPAQGNADQSPAITDPHPKLTSRPTPAVEDEAREIAEGSVLGEIWLKRSGFLGPEDPEPEVPSTPEHYSPSWSRALVMYAGARTPADYQALSAWMNSKEFAPPNETEAMLLHAVVNCETANDGAGALGLEACARRSESRRIQPYLQAAAASMLVGEGRYQDAYDLATAAESALPEYVSDRNAISFIKAIARLGLDQTPEAAANLRSSYDRLAKTEDVSQRTLVSHSYSAVAALTSVGLFGDAENLATSNIRLAETLVDSGFLIARLKQIRGLARFEKATAPNANPASVERDLKLSQADSWDAFVSLKEMSIGKRKSADTFCLYGWATLTLKQTKRYAQDKGRILDPLMADLTQKLSANDVVFGRVRSLHSKYLRTIGDLPGSRKESLAAIALFDQANGGAKDARDERAILKILDQKIAEQKIAQKSSMKQASVHSRA